MGGEGERQRRQAGRQAYGQRVEKRADVSTSCGQKKKKKERNKRCAKRRSTHKSRNGRGEKLQTRSRILTVFGSCEEGEEKSFWQTFTWGG